ncbi:hypothetical protein [Umezawaea sp.]|uniref:hypothetical protein n=1 Tax=Umezawaea sp. TaxID=1955258 RepID=UPI002ED3F61F
MLIESSLPVGRGSSPCTPMPAVLVRTGVLVLVFVVVLVLLRWGYDVPTALALVSGVGLVGVRMGYGVSRPPRNWPLVTVTR